ncbi:ribonuclease HI (plasmid) [Streptosporangium sandarakinum]|uniref:ribonuclease HI n=1 Tax=Streptosporangium sandarakinum TaxID=1260955 RepID=UPI003D8D2C3E
MTDRDSSTFAACADALPTDLRDRVQAMRDYTLAWRACPSCRRIRDLVWLAFDAAFVGDQAAAQEMIEQAELVAAAERDSADCVSQPRNPGRSSRRVPGFDRPGPLVAATDAAHVGACSGMGYLVSDGRWGMRRRFGNGTRYLPDPTGPSKVLVAELRAVALMLDELGDDAARLSLLLVDSTTAIGYLRGWKSGHVTRMPAGYSLRPRLHGGEPALVRLAHRLAALPTLRIEHVKGHSGHPLNEAADSLAKIARRRAVDATMRAERVVDAFLRVWHTRLVAA